MTQAFMTDPALLASLEGRQFIVLRPRAAVMDLYLEAQDAARTILPPVVTYPNTGHVTLRGFAEPERVEDLKQAAREWAAEQAPIDLAVAAIDGFPPPFRIVVLRLARTPSLLAAYSGLTETLNATDFTRVGELSLEDWVFHLSVAYGAELSDDEWQAAHDSLTRVLPLLLQETVSDLEFVWFDGGEHREVIPLGG
ncbi:2'-5' RNA ligase family protein [Psychromicrobium xiongbiense]|uniref:2'-5' RNA ligase family protein n=1 Tax=Psychromicrobium xiongbiense TaxID=3051184 RepID=UPI002555B38C|nr:2'-5' RNA ligase family protein [Psychromicrobium sp. YIM S02556]